MFDRDDPNRPRFNILELKDILNERNELKARVSDLEDELKLYRPSSSRQYVFTYHVARRMFIHACDASCFIVFLHYSVTIFKIFVILLLCEC